jgi:hypothetical protein
MPWKDNILSTKGTMHMYISCMYNISYVYKYVYDDSVLKCEEHSQP